MRWQKTCTILLASSLIAGCSTTRKASQSCMVYAPGSPEEPMNPEVAIGKVKLALGEQKIAEAEMALALRSIEMAVNHVEASLSCINQFGERNRIPAREAMGDYGCFPLKDLPTCFDVKVKQ